MKLISRTSLAQAILGCFEGYKYSLSLFLSYLSIIHYFPFAFSKTQRTSPHEWTSRPNSKPLHSMEFPPASKIKDDPPMVVPANRTPIEAFLSKTSRWRAMFVASCDQNHNQAFHVKVLSDRLRMLSKTDSFPAHELFSAASKNLSFLTHVGIYRPSIPSKAKYDNHMRRAYCPDGFTSHPEAVRWRYKYFPLLSSPLL